MALILLVLILAILLGGLGFILPAPRRAPLIRKPFSRPAGASSSRRRRAFSRPRPGAPPAARFRDGAAG
jgi:hypothetical protein